jgi:hypothetical protein
MGWFSKTKACNMENDVAEEHKALRPAAMPLLYLGLASRNKEHVVKSPFARYPTRAALCKGQEEEAQKAELEQVKKTLEYYTRRDTQLQQVLTTQKTDALRALLGRKEEQIKALLTENARLKRQARHRRAYDDTELLLALQLSAEEFRGEGRGDPDLMSYEQLLELGEQMGTVSVGLSQEQFGALEGGVSSTGQSTCSICQTDIETGQSFKRLPWCAHDHHTECIGQWLQHKNTCPVCKASALAN